MSKIATLDELLNANRIAVHSGQFHADDVVCIALLRTLGCKAEILRTRDAGVLADVIGIDVAGSATGDQFDHHGSAAVKGTCALTKLWDFIKSFRGEEEDVRRLDKILGSTFKAIADVDSGNVENPSNSPNMFGWVSLLNWGTDEKFFEAVDLAEKILREAWARAELWETTLEEARQALTWDGTPPVLDTERQGTKEALHQLGCEAPFFVSPHGEEWAVIQTCPKDAPFNPFGSSRVLPKAWGGLRGEELVKVCGYKSARFAFAPGGGDTVMAFFGDKADAIAAAEAACK